MYVGSGHRGLFYSTKSNPRVEIFGHLCGTFHGHVDGRAVGHAAVGVEQSCGVRKQDDRRGDFTGNCYGLSKVDGTRAHGIDVAGKAAQMVGEGTAGRLRTVALRFDHDVALGPAPEHFVDRIQRTCLRAAYVRGAVHAESESDRIISTSDFFGAYADFFRSQCVCVY